jgi:hypothetical protein
MLQEVSGPTGERMEDQVRSSWWRSPHLKLSIDERKEKAVKETPLRRKCQVLLSE